MAQQVQALEYKPKDPSLISEMHKVMKIMILKVVTSITSYKKQAPVLTTHMHTSD